ncbi:restriction endonuclease, partial [Paeniclostridium sordellii]
VDIEDLNVTEEELDAEAVNENEEYGSGFNSDIFNDTEENKVKKYYLSDVEVKVLNSRVQYYGEDGKLITESLKDYTKKNMKKEFTNLDEFLRRWTEEGKRDEIEKYLLEKGIFLEELEDEVGKDMDVFDLICHIAFDMPPLTRAERANNVKKRNYFGQYSQVAQGVIDKLLEKYENEGITEIEDVKILKLPEFKEFGSQLEIVKKGFGGKKNYEKAMKELVHKLYTIS